MTGMLGYVMAALINEQDKLFVELVFNQTMSAASLRMNKNSFKNIHDECIN